jgi:hypothetical protein
MLTVTKLLAVLVVCGGLSAGCTDDIDEQFDCWAICDKYDECVDGDYDVEDCADRCETEADNDKDFAALADACEACIDDRSCAESVFPCSAECVSIVP